MNQDKIYRLLIADDEMIERAVLYNFIFFHISINAESHIHKNNGENNHSHINIP